MHLHRLGDVAQHHGFHQLLAVLEKFVLSLHDGGSYPKHGVVANLQAANQPARLLQLGTQNIVLATAPQRAGVGLIDPQLRSYRGVKLYNPASVHLTHEHIRHNIFRRRRVDRCARARVTGAHQRERMIQGFVVGLQPPF